MNPILVIAGEPSGEEHAMTFLPRLKELTGASFFGVGGDRLRAQGMELVHHLKDFSSMGFSEVIHKIPFYFKAMDQLEKMCVERNTKDAILVDFQEFNLRLARRLAKRGIRVWYYVAPQAWGWRPWRARTLANTVERLFTILPFEEAWFRDRGVAQVVAVPHPLMKNWEKSLEHLPARPWHPGLLENPRLMILPGSRESEVKRLLPLFIKAVQILKKEIPGMRVGLAKVEHLDPEYYAVAEGVCDFVTSPDKLPEDLIHTDVAIAASGTVTLGTGLLGVPTVVAYQSTLLNEFVLKSVIKYQKDVSLTNLILNERVFPEYLQEAVRPSLMARDVLSWLQHRDRWDYIHERLVKIPTLMGHGEKDVAALMAKGMV